MTEKEKKEETKEKKEETKEKKKKDFRRKLQKNFLRTSFKKLLVRRVG